MEVKEFDKNNKNLHKSFIRGNEKLHEQLTRVYYIIVGVITTAITAGVAGLLAIFGDDRSHHDYNFSQILLKDYNSLQNSEEEIKNSIYILDRDDIFNNISYLKFMEAVYKLKACENFDNNEEVYKGITVDDNNIVVCKEKTGDCCRLKNKYVVVEGVLINKSYLEFMEAVNKKLEADNNSKAAGSEDRLPNNSANISDDLCRKIGIGKI